MPQSPLSAESSAAAGFFNAIELEKTMEFLSAIKELVPDYAKDIRLNVDGTIARSSLEGNDAVGAALAAAYAAKATKLTSIIRNAGVLSPEETNAALTAAALMGMNNVWYPYLEMADNADLRTQPAGLRMNAYASHGGVDKCHFCVKSHYENLVAEGMSTTQLRDVGRIAAVINAVALTIEAEKS
jgi:alkyl hydroperoxide reductase subunit D